MAEAKRSTQNSPDLTADELNDSTQHQFENKHHQDSLQEESKITAAGTVGRPGETSLQTNQQLDSQREGNSKYLLENSILGGGSLLEPSKISNQQANFASRSPNKNGGQSEILKSTNKHQGIAQTDGKTLVYQTNQLSANDQN